MARGNKEKKGIQKKDPKPGKTMHQRVVTSNAEREGRAQAFKSNPSTRND
jgi:hypothetical protein